MAPDVLLRLRAEAVLVPIAGVVIALGLASLLWAFRARRASRMPLYFGIFCTLYGIRMLLQTQYAAAVLGTPAPVRNWTAGVLTHLMAIPATFLVRETVGGGWRNSVTWLLRYQVIVTPLSIVLDIVRGQPLSAPMLNNAGAVAATVILCVSLLTAKLARIDGLKWLWVGLAVFLVSVLDANTVQLAGFTTEPIGFLVLLCAIAYVVGRVVVSAEQRMLGMEHELQTARRIQQSILPQEVPDLPGLTVAARYEPAAEMAGDFYDFLPVDPDRLGVLVADVSGHGVPAALIACMLKSALRAQMPCVSEPAAVLTGMNASLAGQLGSQYVTAAYVFLDLRQGTLTYAGAGHPPLLLWRAESHSIETVECNGLILGPFPNAAYEQVRVEVHPGDRVVLYTDGISETPNAAGEDFGDRQLGAYLQKGAQTPAPGLADAVVAELAEWSAGPQSDDRTLVVIDIGHRAGVTRASAVSA